MKNFCGFFLSAFFVMVMQGQIAVDARRAGEVGLSAKPITPEDLEALKGTTSIFILPESQSVDIEKYQKAFDSVWKINKVKCVTYKDSQKYFGQKGVSFFEITGMNTYVKMSNSGGPNYTHFFLQLYMDDVNGSNKKKFFFNVYLGTKITNVLKFLEGNKNRGSDFLYNIDYFNFKPGYMKAYLAIGNNLLARNQKRFLFSEEGDQNELEKLKRDTLFLAKDIFKEFFRNKTGEETDKVNEQDVMGEYPYRYKVVSIQELNDKILNSQKSVYFLSYLHVSNQLIVSVINAVSGKIVYSRLSSIVMSMGIRSKDVERIFK
jgi:hypothetical protein